MRTGLTDSVIFIDNEKRQKKNNFQEVTVILFKSCLMK